MSDAEEQAQDRKRMLFHRRVAVFIDRWAPSNRLAQADFSADLHNLIAAVYEEAQRPFIVALMAGRMGEASPPVGPLIDLEQSEPKDQ